MSASRTDRKSTRLNSSHPSISYAVFCLKKKKNNKYTPVVNDKRQKAENNEDDDHEHGEELPTTQARSVALASSSTRAPTARFFFLMIRRPPRSTLFPTRRSSDLAAGIRVTDRSRPRRGDRAPAWPATRRRDRKSTRLNSSHPSTSYAVFCLKK